MRTFMNSVVVLACIALCAAGFEDYVPEGVLRCEPADMKSVWATSDDIPEHTGTSPDIAEHTPPPTDVPEHTPTPLTVREEVISDLSKEPAALPADPELTRQPLLSDVYSSVQDFLNAGSPSRLVVLTASWCGPCGTYKGRMSGLTVSESFEADVQLIDIEKHPKLYKLLNTSNSIPQTIWLDSGSPKRNAGPQSRSWIMSKMSADVVTSSTSTTQRYTKAELNAWVRSNYTSATPLTYGVMADGSEDQVWAHLTDDIHGFDSAQVDGLERWVANALHDASHAGKISGLKTVKRFTKDVSRNVPTYSTSPQTYYYRTTAKQRRRSRRGR